MNLSLPNWLRSPNASLEDLEAQLVSAKAAAQQAAQAVSEALTAYDTEPSAKSETALHEARQAAASAAERVARAERLLGPARAKAAEIERQRLTERLAELESEIRSLDRDDDLVRAERDAWLSIVAARNARDAREIETRRLNIEYDSIAAQLDAPRRIGSTGHRCWPAGRRVSDALMATLQHSAGSEFVADEGDRAIIIKLARAASET